MSRGFRRLHSRRGNLETGKRIAETGKKKVWWFSLFKGAQTDNPRSDTSFPIMHARIFLVRHGATVLTAEDRFAGATDVELSDEGREQVRRLADRLAKEKI